ncbi:MAG: Gfo/Idh/MocA family oxidoreductase [Candidatus Rokubacteria bacterium]|nr:Gfo/Idh/MocA family oxidoreductase [Candidatus Rokubacteria bacterium]
MLRGGIIGLGNVALHGHLPGWLRRADVRIVAAADPRPAARAAAMARLPGARWHDEPGALLDEPGLDFVDVCAPPATHAALVGDALARGLHVLCEKPLVTVADDLEAVVALARDRRRVLHTVHNWRHAPIVRRARGLLEAGAIGRVTTVAWRTMRLRPAAAGDGEHGNWRVDPRVAGGGVLSDHGWHVFYVVPGWLRAAPTAIAATLETRRHTAFAVEDTARVRLAFPDATADILLTWAADTRETRARITGTAGRIELADDTLMLDGPDGERRWSCPPGLSDGSAHPEWFHAVAGEFVAAIRGEADGGANLREARLCAALEARARESSRRRGEELGVDPFPMGARC